jgi:hypothetical protein
VELLDGIEVGRVACFSLVGYDVLAGVVAFGGTVPEEETTLESCSVVLAQSQELGRSHEYSLRIEGPPATQLESLHCCNTLRSCSYDTSRQI